MQAIYIESFIRGFCKRQELWRMFAVVIGSILFISAGFFVTLFALPILDFFAIIPSALLFAWLWSWKIKKDYKPKFIEPVDTLIRQGDLGERVGIFLFLSLIMGGIGWGGGFLLSATIYLKTANPYPTEYPSEFLTTFFYGSLLGAFMAASKFAEILKIGK